MTNIRAVRQVIREFISIRVPIYKWDLDYPDVHYWAIGAANYPANTAIELPAMNILNTKGGGGVNSVNTKARFPYRITWIFPGEEKLDNLPLRAVEAALSNLQVFSIVELPDPAVTTLLPVDEQNPVTYARSSEEGNDWLISINFAFDATFTASELADTSELFPGTFYNLETPIPLSEIKIRTNRAKPQFSREQPDTFIEDSELIITK